MSFDTSKWAKSFYRLVENDTTTSNSLRIASVERDYARWTEALTSLVAQSLSDIGCSIAAKQHPCHVQPVVRQEYLSLDLMAFFNSESHWSFPIAVVELENSQQDDIVAYALWKVLCIRDSLRVVFCYRGDRTLVPKLIRSLEKDVVSSLPISVRKQLNRDTLVFVGSRSESETYPYGFFQAWRLNTNVGKFEIFGWQD